MDVELILAAIGTVAAVVGAALLVRRVRSDVAPPPPAFPPIFPEATGGQPAFEAMSIDEIGEWKRARKERGGEGWREEVQVANAIQDAKILDWHHIEARRQIEIAAARREMDPTEMAKQWLNDDQAGRRVQARLFLGLPRLGKE